MNTGTYLDSPNILSRHTRLARDAAGQLQQEIAFDIVDSSVAVQAEAAVDPFEASLRQGVLDTNAEALVAALTCRQAASYAAATCSAVVNAAEAFDVSSLRGDSWMLVASAADLQALRWPPDALVRARHDLDAGYVLVVPERPEGGYASWWRVHPQTGETLGIGTSGRGEAAVTYANLMSAIGFVGGVGFCFIGAALGGAGATSLALCVAGSVAGGGAAIAGASLLGVFLTAAAVLMWGAGGLGVAG